MDPLAVLRLRGHHTLRVVYARGTWQVCVPCCMTGVCCLLHVVWQVASDRCALYETCLRAAARCSLNAAVSCAEAEPNVYPRGRMPVRLFMQLHARKHDRSRSRVSQPSFVRARGSRGQGSDLDWQEKVGDRIQQKADVDLIHNTPSICIGAAPWTTCVSQGVRDGAVGAVKHMHTCACARALPCAFVWVRAPNHVCYERDTQGWQAGARGRKGGRRVGRWARFG